MTDYKKRRHDLYEKTKGIKHHRETLLIEAAPDALEALSALGYRHSPIENTTFYEVRLPKGKTVPQAYDDLDAIDGIGLAELNFELRPSWIPDPAHSDYITQKNNYAAIDVDTGTESIWSLVAEYGQNNPLHSPIVSVIDVDGFETNHPNLHDALKLPGYDAQFGNDNVEPMSGDHGTACAGIIGAIPGGNIGVAGLGFTGQIFPIQVSGGWYVSIFLTALNKALSVGSRVVSISLSIVGITTPGPVEQVYAKAKEQACVICIASGNDNPQQGDNALAHSNNVISVSGLNRVGGVGALNVAPGAIYNEYVDFCAPFYQRTLGLNGSVINFSGTSGSCPIVASLFALVFSLNRFLSWQEAVDIVAMHCVPETPPSGVPRYSKGVPQFLKTVKYLMNPSGMFVQGIRRRQAVYIDSGRVIPMARGYYITPEGIPELVWRHSAK